MSEYEGLGRLNAWKVEDRLPSDSIAGGSAPPVTTPWGDRNARVRTPDGMQLTLFTVE